MVDQEDVEVALRELGGKATIREIVGHMYLKKQFKSEYSLEAASIVSRILNALKRWETVDKMLNIYKHPPVKDTADVWFIRKQKV